MAEMLASNLVDKSVVGSDGRELGKLHQLLIDPRTGNILELVIEQGEHSLYGLDLIINDNGRYRCPIDRVRSVRNHIIVEV